MQIVTLEPEIRRTAGKRDAKDAVVGEELLDVLRILGLSSISAARGATLSWTSSRMVSRICDLLFRELEVHGGSLASK